MKIQKIQKINRAYVGDGIAQVMTLFRDSYMSILNGDGLLYHYSLDNIYYNEYLDDSRRFQFPYWNIPIHREMKDGFLVTYVNEIFDIGRPYIILKDGMVIQNLLFNVSNNLSSTIITHRLLSPKFSYKIEHVKMEDLDERIDGILRSNDGEKYIFSDGGVLSDNISYDGKSKYEIKKVDSKLIITTNNGLINSLKGIKIIKKPYNFEIMIFDFPTVEYSINNIKSIERDVSFAPEPKIKRKFNLGVSREDIISAKTMVRLKNRN